MREYRPMSAEHRARLSAAHRARLGLPPGHRFLYGVVLPIFIADKLQPWAAYLARAGGNPEAFVKREFARYQQLQDAKKPAPVKGRANGEGADGRTIVG